MYLGRFFLYYGIAIQILFCMFIFNPKLEWALFVAMFYAGILFIFGLASEINPPSLTNGAPNTNVFMGKFIGLTPVKSFGEFVKNNTNIEIAEYVKYLILIPPAFNLASIKLITNYDGNKKIHKSKSKLKQLDTAKFLICMHVFLLAIIVLFGFPSSYMPIDLPNIPLYALGLLSIVSIAELFTSISIYISY
jgi:hypothetical protein